MAQPRTLAEMNLVTAVRLTEKRQRPREGDLFRFSPVAGHFGWGRLISRNKFFGLAQEFNLVYVYDAWGATKPDATVLTPGNLLIGPSVVNNLGWSRGFWEVVETVPILPADILPRHIFKTVRGATREWIYQDEFGNEVKASHAANMPVGKVGFGNFNVVDWKVRQILRERGVLSA